MPSNPPPEFNVLNRVRSLIFMLLYVEMFVLSIWLFPSYQGLVMIGVVLSTLPVIRFSPRLYQSLEKQIFDRIRLRDHGVEYASGVWGDNWDRPYNEFRVDCQSQRILFLRFYHVRLKHRVLANLLLSTTRSREIAQHKISELVDNSRLRFTKN